MFNAGLKTVLTETVRETYSIAQFGGEQRRPRLTTAAIAATDAVGLTFALVVSLAAVAAGHSLVMEFWLRSWTVVPVTLMVLATSGLYPALGMDVMEETRRIVMCISFVQLGSLCTSWATHAAGSQLQTLLFWALSLGAVPLGRSLIRGTLARKRWWGEPVILIGSGGTLAEIFNLITSHPRLGLHASGILNETGGLPGGSGLPVLHDLETCLAFARRRRIQTAVVALGGSGGLSVFEATNRYGIYFPKLIVIPPISPRFNLCSKAGTLGGYLSIQVSHNLLMPSSRMWKRGLDLAIAVPCSVLLLPLMLLIAAAIKLSSPGPLFFGHRRIGRDDVPFRAWKFRTMVSNADTLLAERLATNSELRKEWERDHKLRNDPRVTGLGTIMRRYSLDELPQLWNVIRSEMSIVGPRPISAAEVSKYAEYFADYSRVLPGITGLWQVSGRNETTYEERVQLDTYYVNNWSPWLDLYIIARTFRAVFSTRGAY